MSDKIERPEIVTDDHLIYLDELRDSGDTNMLGAGPWLREEFPELTRDQSWRILQYWMESFTERHKCTP